MEKISYNLVFNRKKRLNKKGMALVQVEAYLNRRKIYFSTKIYLKPEQWDTKRRMVKGHPNADVLNRMLYEHIAAIEQINRTWIMATGEEYFFGVIKGFHR